MPDELTVYVHGERFMIVRGEDVVQLQGRAAARFVDELEQQYCGSSALGVFATEHAHAGALADERGQLEGLRAALASGELVAVRVQGPARTLSETPIEPLVPRGDDPGGDDPGGDDPTRPLRPAPPPPTWISVEVVHHDGARYPGKSLEVVSPSGVPRTAVLDGASVWRVDDIDGTGHCKLLGSPALADPRPVTSIALVHDDAWLAPTRAASVRLCTERHHRVVVFSGSTTIDLFDPASRPAAFANCRVALENRQLDGRTDASGRFVAHHPAGARVVKVSFPVYDQSKIHSPQGKPRSA